MYGAQTQDLQEYQMISFENDVEMYGAQTTCFRVSIKSRLRMM